MSGVLQLLAASRTPIVIGPTTFDPAQKSSNLTLSNGNLTVTGNGTADWLNVRSSTNKAYLSGKFYSEFEILDIGTEIYIGIAATDVDVVDGTRAGSNNHGGSYRSSDGKMWYNSSPYTYGGTYTTGDIIRVAFDFTNGNVISWYKNATSYGGGFNAYTSLDAGIQIAIKGSGSVKGNFGGSAFSYAAPSGYVAWSPTYATWNSADKNETVTLSGGDLIATVPSQSNWFAVRDTISKASGKWYFEITLTAGTECFVGVGTASQSIATGHYIGNSVNSWAYYSSSGLAYYNNSGTGTRATWTTGAVIGVAYDGNADTLSFYKNGSLEGTAVTGVTGTLYPMVSLFNSASVTANFGATAWAYSPPADHLGWQW